MAKWGSRCHLDRQGEAKFESIAIGLRIRSELGMPLKKQVVSGEFTS